MSDLEKFLQQAAQRMKERQQGGGQQPAQQQPQRVQPARPPEPPPNRPPVLAKRQLADAEIVEADVVYNNPRELGPDRLSSLDTRTRPGSDSVNQADERMASHVHQMFDHSVGQLSQKPAIKVDEPTTIASDQTNRRTEVKIQRQNIHPLALLLRRPDTLRAAILAAEIFQRKF